jgi:hypothetical protein
MTTALAGCGATLLPVAGFAIRLPDETVAELRAEEAPTEDPQELQRRLDLAERQGQVLANQAEVTSICTTASIRLQDESDSDADEEQRIQTGSGVVVGLATTVFGVVGLATGIPDTSPNFSFADAASLVAAVGGAVSTLLVLFLTPGDAGRVRRDQRLTQIEAVGNDLTAFLQQHAEIALWGLGDVAVWNQTVATARATCGALLPPPQEAPESAMPATTPPVAAP